jgi:hypothetical protein
MTAKRRVAQSSATRRKLTQPAPTVPFASRPQVSAAVAARRWLPASSAALVQYPSTWQYVRALAIVKRKAWPSCLRSCASLREPRSDSAFGESASASAALEAASSPLLTPPQ